MTPEALLTVDDICDKLRVSRPWVYKACRAGRIPHVRLGGDDGPVRFIPEEIDAWLAQARRAWRPGDSTTATLRRAAG